MRPPRIAKKLLAGDNLRGMFTVLIPQHEDDEDDPGESRYHP